jgi:hypothetical protein
VKKLGAVVLGVLFLCICGLASSASALPILDQSYTSSALPGGVSSTEKLAQSFTVGLTGTLTSVDARFRTTQSSPLLVQIRNTNADGSPGSSVLGNVTLPGPMADSMWRSIDFSSFGISVTSGDVLALFMEATYAHPALVGWRGSQAAGYAGGRAWSNAGSGWEIVAQDFNFRTYVDDEVSVPEPATILLLVSGFAGLGLVRRRLRG